MSVMLPLFIFMFPSSLDSLPALSQLSFLAAMEPVVPALDYLYLPWEACQCWISCKAGFRSEAWGGSKRIGNWLGKKMTETTRENNLLREKVYIKKKCIEIGGKVTIRIHCG